MGRVVHFEIHASDPEKAAAFYSEVFGWQVRAIPELNYWIFDTGGGDGINGGLLRRRGAGPLDGQPVNGFVCSIAVDSAKAALETALAAGASIALDLHAIPGVGFQAYIKDVDGNIVGLHQADPSAR